LRAEWQLLPSRQRRLLALGVAAALAAASWLGRLDDPWLLLLGLLALATALRDGLPSRRWRVRGFALQDGQWLLHLPGRSEPAELVEYHFPARRLGLLCFALASGRRLRVPLFPDSLSPEAFRQLAVALA
jgi:hypothetical protein